MPDTRDARRACPAPGGVRADSIGSRLRVQDMSVSANMTRIPVEYLEKGLYVAELDRPWTEIPLMFQGFEISTDEELEILRDHCSFVYVDMERSSPDVIDEVDTLGPPSHGDPGVADNVQAAPVDVTPVFGAAREPDKEIFRSLVRRAYESRTRAREFVDSVMSEVANGRGVDTQAASGVIEEMVAKISDNASAALWLTSLKDKDEYTTVHSINVCILALAFGLHLGYEGQDLQQIGVGALLHDVGKMRTPSEILNKLDPLTPEELRIVRRHAQEGYEIVSQAGGGSREALEIIRLHHERVDGQGYPLGLVGGQIPLHVRLVALVDAYDAMTSPRQFREPMPADQALQRLYNEADGRFGTQPVQEFIRCVGVYPVGCLVELDNGALAIVLGQRTDARLRPTVLMVRTPDGKPYEKRLVTNLDAEPGADDAAAPRFVRRVVNPAAEGVDVAGIVAVEFGLEAAG